MGVTTDVAQIKNYIVNNRHNHITAFYYLLKKKAEKNPGILQPEREEKRSNSPLIYKPEQKKDFFMPFKKTTTTNDKNTTKVNDSFNASKIVSSLVEANKTKIISNINNPKTRKTETFEKLEEFKLFPKQRNGSQYEPDSSNTSVIVNPINLAIKSNTNKPHALTSRNDAEDKKNNYSKGFEKEPIFRPVSRHEASASVTSRPSQEETNPSENLAFTDRRELTEVKTEDHQIKNKRREELSDQLKQISLKIDK